MENSTTYRFLFYLCKRIREANQTTFSKLNSEKFSKKKTLNNFEMKKFSKINNNGNKKFHYHQA